MEKSVIEGLLSVRHEHQYEFEAAYSDATWFLCIKCLAPLIEYEDAGTGA